jgi:2-C-methyl-D-erythritol 4-phosphate cytidylyltransferase
MLVSGLIVAAGKGTRMGPGVDKLFLNVAGMPVIAHTWRTFDGFEDFNEIILVIRDGMQDAFAELATKYGFQKKFKLIAGGQERQDSVWNGLSALDPATEIVAIQDGARPCTSHQLIGDTITAAKACGAAVAAVPMTDTIKESGDGKFIERTVDRSRLWAVQTPQTFRVPLIRHALAEVRAKGLAVTDDTAACELTGHPVQLVHGSDPNPKVTRPEDLEYVELLLRKRGSKSPR